MNNVYREITLDLLNQDKTIKIYAKRLDDSVRHLTITIVNGSSSYTIPTGANIVFQGTKPDSTHFMYDCVLNSNNTIDVELTSQVLAVEGIVSCEIEISESDDVISTSTFKIKVEDKALSPDVVHSTDEYLSLYNILQECRGYSSQIINDAESCSQYADEAKASAELASSIVNCVPLANIEDNLTTTTSQHVLSSNQGKVLNDTKVDKVTGKGLSTEDFTTEFKTKLESVDASAKNTIIKDVLTSTSTTSALSANQGKVLDDKITVLSEKSTDLDSRKEVFVGDTAEGAKSGDIQFKTDGSIKIYDGTTWNKYTPKYQTSRSFGKITYKSGVTNQTNASGIIKDNNTGLCVMTLACTLKATGGTWETIGYLPSDFYPYDYDPDSSSSGSENGGAIGSVVITDGGSTITGAELSIGDSGKIRFKSAGTVGSRWIVGSVTYFCNI